MALPPTLRLILIYIKVKMKPNWKLRVKFDNIIKTKLCVSIISLIENLTYPNTYLLIPLSIDYINGINSKANHFINFTFIF
jgi:hypothetical protein